MNTAKSLELSIANMVRQYCELGNNVLLRPWQSLDEDGLFKPANDRTFPCVDIRFSAPSYDDNQVTLVCMGFVTAMTTAIDDVNHQSDSEIFDNVFNLVLDIFRSSCSPTDTALYDELKELNAEIDGGKINIGGITMENGVPPSDDAGENQIGIAIGVHFSYAP
jgi:hypothetical protein